MALFPQIEGRSEGMVAISQLLLLIPIPSDRTEEAE